MEIGFVSHSAAAAAYLVLTILLLVGWKGWTAGAFLVLASAVTSVWAGVTAYDVWASGAVLPTAHVAEVLRSGSWLAFLFGALASAGLEANRRIVPIALRPVALALCLFLVGLDIWNSLAPYDFVTWNGGELRIAGGLLMALLGMTLVENLFRNTRPDERWRIKFLCIGVGGIFAYDFFLYSDSLLFRHIDPVLISARGFTNALVVPLIAVSAARNPQWSLDVFVSRRMVFHTATLMGGGVYLLLMAAAGYYLREFGGSWGPIVQVTFLTGALILLFVVLFSGRARAQLKLFVSKHFFSYQYDYREEWLRFIRTMSSPEQGVSLRLRVIQAVADIMDSPGGAVWLRTAPDRFTLAQSWNLHGPNVIEATDAPFLRLLEREQTVINLDEVQGAEPGVAATLPDTLRDSPGLWPNLWLMLPLVHRDRLTGLLILEKPRAHRQLNWEAYELLKTLARQAASYIAEEEAAEALAEAKQFDTFNRRFAFIMHDMKGIVSELSLIVANAVKHGRNPAFQEDVIRTVEEAVGKMNRLLLKLKSDRQGTAAQPAVDLAPMLRQVVKQKGGTRALVLDCRDNGLAVAADPDRLASVVGHLIQNAIDAVDENGSVEVRLRAEDDKAVIEVKDNGPGMDAEFVRQHLFRPFRTTKDASFGLGLYETREFARQHGGALDVDSRPGHGTTMRLTFPARRGNASALELLDEAGTP
ncbi:MAG: XrtA/PEP-CTERM system histidine kinase PrsK [Alphaproteobacteria bacterium]